MMTSAETTKSVARATIYYYSYTINTKDGTIDSNKWKEIIILFAPFAVRDCGVLGDTHANPPTADWCPRPTLPPGLLDRIVITVSRCGPYMHAGMTFMLMVHTVYAWCWPSTVPPPPFSHTHGASSGYSGPGSVDHFPWSYSATPYGAIVSGVTAARGNAVQRGTATSPRSPRAISYCSRATPPQQPRQPSPLKAASILYARICGNYPVRNDVCL